MPEAVFVISPDQDQSLRELAETLAYELGRQDVPSTVHVGVFPPPRPQTVNVLIDPRGYVIHEGPQALPADAQLRRTVFICDNDPVHHEVDPHLALLKRAGAVFDTDQTAVAADHRNGLPARLLRAGYSASLDCYEADAARPIDVMFTGRRSPRRTRALNHAAAVLARRNTLLDLSPDRDSPQTTSSYLGTSRWPLLAQTKIVMQVHHGDGRRFAWRQALDAIHAGAVVVTEHASGIIPLDPGVHVTVASLDSMPYVVERLLDDEPRLAEMRAAAYERLSDWLPYALWVSVLRAALVELVGEPVESGDGQASASGRESTVVAEAPAAPDPGSVSLHRKLAAARAEAAALRRRVRALADEVLEATGAPRVRPAAQTPAWVARDAPRISVLLTGSEPAALIGTLDSVAACRGHDRELIVAVGGQDAAAAVAQWLAAHPRVPAIALLPAVDVGMGALRNIALDWARGAQCLLLEAGHELYPHCLDVLGATLTALKEMCFVYPMIEVTGDAEGFVAAGGDYLLNQAGWDPDRLAAANEIQTPALVRTAMLRAVGAGTTDPALAGREDWELWRRIAAAEGRGQRVPQILARRPESADSRVLLELAPA